MQANRCFVIKFSVGTYFNGTKYATKDIFRATFFPSRQDAERRMSLALSMFPLEKKDLNIVEIEARELG